MPTYYATGVTASLAVCELRHGVSNVIDFQCHPEQHADAKRMNDALDKATPLHERLIKGEGSNASVIQFLGIDQDMPMKMLVASSTAETDEEIIDDETMPARDPGTVATPPPSSGISSPLTSLGATPTPTKLSFDDTPWEAATGPKQAAERAMAAKTIAPSIEELPYIGGPQSLVIKLTLSLSSFLPVFTEQYGVVKKMQSSKDLKVEIFMNGELVEVDFISGRNATRKSPSLTMKYTGRRLHRQIEKPFAYVPSHINSDLVGDAAEQWNGVSKALQLESELRGRDEYGDVSPSAEYLMALSQLALPDSVKASKGLGIIDVVITAGKGQKYGSEVEYLTGPTRMHDAAYSSSGPIVDPTIMLDRDPISLPSSMEDVLSSPEIPLAQVRTRAAQFELTSPAARSEKTLEELKKSLGLDINLQTTRIDGFENARGVGNGKGRNLLERLGDIKKMSPTKQQQEIAKLRNEFSTTGAVQAPPKKKLKINAPTNALPPLALADDTMSPVDMFKPSTPTHLRALTLSQATENDYLAGNQNVFAMRADEPAQLPAQAPQPVQPVPTTPQKRTKASALANSPARVPVKLPPKDPRTGKGPRPRKVAPRVDDTAISFNLDGDGPQTERKQPSMLLSDGSTPSRGAARSAKAWYPKEKTADQALADFQVPPLSKGSCVTYAPDLGVAGGGGAAVGGKVRRQVMKSRKGEFREEQVVVGMRFCVV